MRLRFEAAVAQLLRVVRPPVVRLRTLARHFSVGERELLPVGVTLAKLAIFFANFAIFWRARSRLYQNEFLQRKYAFDSIFQALQYLHPFAPLQAQIFRKKSV